MNQALDISAHHVCFNCKQEKPLTEFRANRSDFRGHHGNCKTCESEKARHLFKRADEYRREQIARGAVKVCRLCNAAKSITEYSRCSDSKDGSRNDCKKCSSARSRIWRKGLPETEKKSSTRRYWLKSRYKLTEAAFDAMLAQQNNKCAICMNSFAGKSKGRMSPYVDHDHATGAIRALLCHPCNAGLGSFCENLSTLQSAIQYLHKHAIR